MRSCDCFVNGFPSLNKSQSCFNSVTCGPPHQPSYGFSRSVWSCLRTFILAVPSACSVLPVGFHVEKSLSKECYSCLKAFPIPIPCSFSSTNIHHHLPCYVFYTFSVYCLFTYPWSLNLLRVKLLRAFFHC